MPLASKKNDQNRPEWGSRREEFFTVRDEVKKALLLGRSQATIYRALKNEEKVKMSYPNFTRLVRQYLSSTLTTASEPN